MLIFIAYNTITIKMFGVPESISGTYYLLEERRKSYGWFFTLFCLGTGFTLLPPWLDMTPESYQFSSFLTVAGLLFVGAAAQFKDVFTAKVHYSAAVICCVFSQVWCICAGYWWVSLISFTITMGYSLIRDSKKWMFWLEMAAAGAMYVSIFLSNY